MLLSLYLQISNKVIVSHHLCCSFSYSIFCCLMYDVLNYLKNKNLWINEILNVQIKFQSNPFKLTRLLLVKNLRINGIFLFFFCLHHQFSLVRGSVLASSGSSPLPIAVAGIEPWSSLPSSAPITTEPTNDW
jgi:hypothetical protein